MSQNYRSLYWRIGLCFIGIIAAVLAIQGIVLLWLVNEPDQEARTTVTAPLARALGDALANNPSLDIKAFAERQLPTPPRPYYIIMTSGDAYFFGKRRPSDVAVQTVREVFQMPGEAIYPRNWDGAPYWSSPLQVNGTLRGIVAVVPRDQIAELWPRMAALAFALFTVGTMLASQFIFRPAHRRLKALESTARRLGAGDINARAVEDGGD
ncbi:MAG: hypothetical protein LBQ09_10510, partial [Acidobacteriaceae bacterium]|nr:hypothetical protein [Acidobacteriaceae bacterium]